MRIFPTTNNTNNNNEEVDVVRSDDVKSLEEKWRNDYNDVNRYQE